MEGDLAEASAVLDRFAPQMDVADVAALRDTLKTLRKAMRDDAQEPTEIGERAGQLLQDLVAALRRSIKPPNQA